MATRIATLAAPQVFFATNRPFYKLGGAAPHVRGRCRSGDARSGRSMTDISYLCRESYQSEYLPLSLCELIVRKHAALFESGELRNLIRKINLYRRWS